MHYFYSIYSYDCLQERYIFFLTDRKRNRCKIRLDSFAVVNNA